MVIDQPLSPRQQHETMRYQFSSYTGSYTCDHATMQLLVAQYIYGLWLPSQRIKFYTQTSHLAANVIQHSSTGDILGYCDNVSISSNAHIRHVLWGKEYIRSAPNSWFLRTQNPFFFGTKVFGIHGLFVQFKHKF